MGIKLGRNPRLTMGGRKAPCYIMLKDFVFFVKTQKSSDQTHQMTA